MENVIESSTALLTSLKADYLNLKAAFKAETDIEKMDVLDTQISKMGKDIVDLESKRMAFEVAAKKTSFNPTRLAPLLAEMNAHREETSRVIQEHTDSVMRATYLASRITSGTKLIGSLLAKIV